MNTHVIWEADKDFIEEGSNEADLYLCLPPGKKNLKCCKNLCLFICLVLSLLFTSFISHFQLSQCCASDFQSCHTHPHLFLIKLPFSRFLISSVNLLVFTSLQLIIGISCLDAVTLMLLVFLLLSIFGASSAFLSCFIFILSWICVVCILESYPLLTMRFVCSVDKDSVNNVFSSDFTTNLLYQVNWQRLFCKTKTWWINLSWSCKICQKQN